MISQISFHRMLYVGMGPIAAVAAILAILAIHPSAIPEHAIIPIWLTVIVHLLIIVALIWTIKVYKRGDDRKELQIIAGVILIVFGLLISTGSFAYPDSPYQPSVGIWMFICSGCDIVVGLLILIARFFRRTRQLSK